MEQFVGEIFSSFICSLAGAQQRELLMGCVPSMWYGWMDGRMELDVQIYPFSETSLYLVKFRTCWVPAGEMFTELVTFVAFTSVTLRYEVYNVER